MTLATIGNEELSQIEQVIINGDLKTLTPEQRVQYYKGVCESMGLNPLTQPLQYITLQGKLTLYAGRQAVAQLCGVHRISTTIVSQNMIDEATYCVVARANKEGQQADDIAFVDVGAKSGVDKANEMMKCVTKARRRAVLSLIGLGLLDESEVETIPGRQTVTVAQDGEITEQPHKALRGAESDETDAVQSYGYCDWHDTHFDVCNRAGKPFHRIAGYFCTGQRIVDGQGEVIHERPEPEVPEVPEDIPDAISEEQQAVDGAWDALGPTAALSH